MVKKLSDVTEKIIPFLDKYPLEGYKRLNYDDFVKVAILIKDKRHLIREGLEQIRKIKAGTNQGR